MFATVKEIRTFVSDCIKRGDRPIDIEQTFLRWIRATSHQISSAIPGHSSYGTCVPFVPPSSFVEQFKDSIIQIVRLINEFYLRGILPSEEESGALSLKFEIIKNLYELDNFMRYKPYGTEIYVSKDKKTGVMAEDDFISSHLSNETERIETETKVREWCERILNLDINTNANINVNPNDENENQNKNEDENQNGNKNGSGNE